MTYRDEDHRTTNSTSTITTTGQHGHNAVYNSIFTGDYHIAQAGTRFVKGLFGCVIALAILTSPFWIVLAVLWWWFGGLV